MLFKRGHAYAVLLLLFYSWWTCGSDSTADCRSEETNAFIFLMVSGTVVA
jgi:hypothetical protein